MLTATKIKPEKQHMYQKIQEMIYQILFWGLDNLLISLCSPFKKHAQNTSTAPFLPHAQLINPSVCISGFSLQHLAEYCNLLKQPVLGKQIATPRLRFSFKFNQALNKSSSVSSHGSCFLPC